MTSNLPPFLAGAVPGTLSDSTRVDASESSTSLSATAALSRSVLPTSNAGNLDLASDIRTPPTSEEPKQQAQAAIEAASSSTAIPSLERRLEKMDDELAGSSRSTDRPALLVPPLNFDMVCSRSSRKTFEVIAAANTPSSANSGGNNGAGGASSAGNSSSSSTGGAIYRSGFPNERNYPFLATLRLRTVVYLSSDDVRPNLQRWIDASHGQTQLLHFRLNVNKEPFAEMDKSIVAQALSAIVDQRNLPLLMHCNKGKYRVGVLTALVRRLQGWSMTSIYEEYARFAGHDRIADEEFIDMFPLHTVAYDLRHAPDWLRL